MDFNEEDKEAGNKPFFLSHHPKMKLENWSLEQIRRKFYRDIGPEGKDYQRDKWMCKTIFLIHYIHQHENVNLYDLSLFMGMPRSYLATLSRRDTGFRNWIVSLRHSNIDHKVERAQDCRLGGIEEDRAHSILFRFHNNPNRGAEGLVTKYREWIDVGWTKEMKRVSNKLS